MDFRLLFIRQIRIFLNSYPCSCEVYPFGNSWAIPWCVLFSLKKNEASQRLPLIFSLLSFSRWRGALGIMLFASWYCGSPTLQKTSVFFLEAILQHLKKERIAHQDDGHEARRTIGFEWYFLCDPLTIPGSIRRNTGVLLRCWVGFKTWELQIRMRL